MKCFNSPFSILPSSFVAVIRRNKTAAILNLLGLSVAFAAFMLLFMQLKYDWGFDKFHPKADCIYRLEIAAGQDKYQAVICRPMADIFIKSSPHIVAGTLTSPFSSGTANFSVTGKDGVENHFVENLQKVYPSLPQVFGSFRMLEGKADAMDAPQTVLMPESMARKMLGDGPYVGANQAGESPPDYWRRVPRPAPQFHPHERDILSDDRQGKFSGMGKFQLLLVRPSDKPGRHGRPLGGFCQTAHRTRQRTWLGQHG
ncbi:MAG: hypothetical protein LBL81_02710 [Tannerella sp.]|jgi:hypothetical protein|nr:hypothetical protein [Tannerella sp.]